MQNQSPLPVMFSREQIQSTVDRLAAEIQQDYRGKSPVFLGVLKGSFMFMADLVRALDMPVEVEFIRLSSYKKGTASSGKVQMVHGLSCEVKGRDILIVEDIVDTGLTTNFLMEYLQKRKPASLKLCALVNKTYRRQAQVKVDYPGFTVPDRFMVGYGLDCDEKYRNLPDICFIAEDINQAK
jgi:hypoxanthine phosphoribosyltransferase